MSELTQHELKVENLNLRCEVTRLKGLIEEVLSTEEDMPGHADLITRLELEMPND